MSACRACLPQLDQKVNCHTEAGNELDDMRLPAMVGRRILGAAYVEGNTAVAAVYTCFACMAWVVVRNCSHNVVHGDCSLGMVAWR